MEVEGLINRCTHEQLANMDSKTGDLAEAVSAVVSFAPDELPGDTRTSENVCSQ
jgi:hypothetical protein